MEQNIAFAYIFHLLYLWFYFFFFCYLISVGYIKVYNSKKTFMKRELHYFVIPDK